MKLFKASLLLPSLVGLCLLSGQLQAGLITGATPGAGMGPGANANLLLGPIVPVTGAEGAGDYVGLLGGNPNFVTISLDVFAMDVPFEIDFALGSGAVPFPNETEYAFAVSITNRLNDNGIDPGDSMKEINGLDIDLVPSAGALVTFDITTPPAGATGAGFPLAFETPNLGSGIRFGGLSGGGGGIPYGMTQTLFFSVDVVEFFAELPPGAGFTLRFTANPEPEAILLGTFTLALGGFFVYRRRNQKIKIQNEAATQAV